MKKIIIVFSFFIININAQDTVLKSEIGVFIGVNAMQTDYGQAKNLKSTLHNKGVHFGIAYIADFSESKFKSKLFNFISRSVKTRYELSYNKNSFEHDGELVADNTNPEYANYKAMLGETTLISFGGFSEIYFRPIKENYKFQPYFLTGISYSLVSPSLKTDKPLPSIYTPKNENVFLEKQNIFSFSYGLGLRIKSGKFDFIIETRYNPFMSDKIEGLDSNTKGDKYNDNQIMVNLGMIYKFKKRKT